MSTRAQTRRTYGDDPREGGQGRAMVAVSRLSLLAFRRSARRCHRRGCMGAIMSRIWHCQNPSKVASSVLTKLASGGCRLKGRSGQFT